MQSEASVGPSLAAAVVFGTQRDDVEVYDRIDITTDIRRGIRNYGATNTTKVNLPVVPSTAKPLEGEEHQPIAEVPGDLPVPPPPPYDNSPHESSIAPTVLSTEQEGGNQEPPDRNRPVPHHTLTELDNNPLYHCLRAQMNNQDSQCCDTLNMLYAHTSQFPRVAHSPLSPTLERAYRAGWAMVNTVMFPLVSNLILRCVWALIQLFLFGLGYLSVLSILSCGFPTEPFVINAVACFLAFIDTIFFFTTTLFQRYYVGEETRQLLLGQYHSRNERRWSWLKRVFAFVNKYNDLFRLAYAEVFLFTTTGAIILDYWTHLNEHNESSIWPYDLEYCYIYWSWMNPLFIAYATLVYLAQIIAILQMLNFVRKTRIKTPARRMAGWLTLHLLLHYVIQRVAQAAMLIIYIVVADSIDFDNYNTYAFVCIMASAYLTPVLGIATFPILRRGWIQDFCIVWCTDFLAQLEEVRRDPQTPQDTRDAIQELLQWFHYQTLAEESRPLTESRTLTNILYPLQRPFLFVMCVPYLACMVILIFGVLFMHIPSFSSPVPYVVTGLILIYNGQLVLVAISWIVMFIPYLCSLIPPLLKLCSDTFLKYIMHTVFLVCYCV